MAEAVVPVLHVAAYPLDDGTQLCQRCGMVLHWPGTGAPPPWYPGQLVSVCGPARAAVRAAPEGWPECVPAPA